MKSVIYKTQKGNRYKIYLFFVGLFFIPTFALADDSGKCGFGVTYTYDSATRTLTISGSGDMTCFDNEKKVPWKKYKKEISNIVINEGVKTIGRSAFNECISLKKVSIPYSLEIIYDYAFYNCNNLSSVKFPDSYFCIYWAAFMGCTKLDSIYIPSLLRDIDEGAFAGCNLSHIEVDKDNRKYDSRDNCNAIIETTSNKLIIGCKNTVIPNSVTSIERRAFLRCNGLTSITIPQNVEFIGESALEGCNELVQIVVDKDNRKYDSRDNCNAIIETASNKLIIGCKNTDIPNSVTSIEKSAFEDCVGLTSIIIPANIKRIGGSAFENCTNLKNIFIPNSINSINYATFRNCVSLVSIEIPKSVTDIDASAFEDCLNLRDIFLHCKILSKLEFSFESYVKKHLNKSIVLHVPEHLLQMYKNDKAWSFFKYIVPITQQEENEYLAKSASPVMEYSPQTQVVAQNESKEETEQKNSKEKENESNSLKQNYIKNDYQKRIALVIGNADYQNITKLNSPIKDAEDVTSKLKTLGFEEVLLVRNASHQQMEKALDNFVHKAQNYDVALVYYSGHGVESKNINYLLPIEFEEREESDLKYDCLIAQRVVDKLDNTGCPMKILILDACRNPLKAKGLSDGMITMEASEGTYIVCATSQDDKAIDGKIGENSPFTKAFLKELDKPNVKLNDVFNAVAKDVRKATGKTPWINHKFYDDFYFFIK